MAVRLMFPDGVTIRGRSATDALRTWGSLQWTPEKDPARIRAALAERAWNWSMTKVDPALPDDEFLTAIESAHLCAVSWEGTKVKPAVSLPGVHERSLLGVADSYVADLQVIDGEVESGDDLDSEC